MSYILPLTENRDIYADTKETAKKANDDDMEANFEKIHPMPD